MCLNGMCLKIRTSTCFHQGSRAPNSSAFERNYCRTALLTCLYFAFICSSYTKHTFMVDRRGNAPRLSACKAEVLLLSLPAHKKSVSLTRAVCKQASWRLVSKSSTCSLQRSCSPCSALESNYQQTTESYRHSHCHCTETNCYCDHFKLGVAFAIF